MNANQLDGYDGDDRLVGGLGADNLIGGDGTDEADYSASGAAVTVDLTQEQDLAAMLLVTRWRPLKILLVLPMMTR